MDFTLINTQVGLDRMVDVLSNEKVIAFDIECASNLHHYINRVCLMQFFACKEAFVVDALADIDFEPIGRLLENPDIEIVMHDTDFDLRSLDNDYGWHPRNLFDTLIAARLCGHKEFGLGTLLERHFGIRGSKGFQRADWTIRPIPLNMLEYAVSDVTVLLRLRDLLLGEIERLGRKDWAMAEFAQCEEKRFEPDKRPLFARVKKARELCNGRELAVLNELAKIRDKIAKTLDLPHFMVIGDEILIDLAKGPPKTTQELVVLRGIHPACKKRYAKFIVEAAQKGQESPEIKWPQQHKRHGGYSQTILDSLKEWRSAYSSKLGVDPDVVLSMKALKRLAGGEKIESVLQGEPVRLCYGEEIKRELAVLLR